jgi:pimeloyl-ACP methyl ester carboxylesterase
VIKYDRRGFGKSDKPWDGYDYDTLTDDLHAVMESLDLKDAVLVGFSMGGGEAARYISRYGTERVSKIVLVSSVLPYLAKTNDNEDGVDQSVFAEMMEQVSTPLLDYYRGLASVALPRATQQCALSFANTDFRADVQQITIPTMIIHGDDDLTVPINASSNRTAAMLPDARYIVYDGAPHGLFYTHRQRLNQDLIDFCMDGVRQESRGIAQRNISM